MGFMKNEQDYDLALKELERVFHAKPNTREGDFFEVLPLLVQEYEQKHYAIEPLTPLQALKYEMEEQGLTQSDLAKRFAMSKSTISEILNGHKQMSVRFMKYLHHDLGIPAHILLS